MPETLNVNVDDLTLGEVDDFEEASGLSIVDVSKLLKGKKPLPAKALIALVWITKRRADESYTLEQARSVKVSELETEPRPTKGKS